jgi:putative ABC transport system substrate-binding protein
MNRRAIITLLGGAAAWPVVARGQQGERMRRIGVLMFTAADDPYGRKSVNALQEGLQGSEGSRAFVEGENLTIPWDRRARFDPVAEVKCASRALDRIARHTAAREPLSRS